jgi:hypothetical protein
MRTEMISEKLGNLKQLACLIACKDLINFSGHESFTAYINEKFVFIILMSKNIIWNSYIHVVHLQPPTKKSMVPLKSYKVQHTTYRTL